MPVSTSIRLRLCVALLAAVSTLSHARAQDPVVRLGHFSQTQIDHQLYLAAGHPNEQWRYQGLRQHLAGRDAQAVLHFERAAGYADKISQHYLSLLYWYGQGVPQDRVLAYIWSDLAAERGHRNLLRIREKMWLELTEAQRAQVIQRGEGMHRQYADAFTRIRTERALFRFATQMTGSKAGFDGHNLTVQFGPSALQGTSTEGGITGLAMYGDERTDRRVYWQAQDRMLEGPLRATVTIGPLEPHDRTL
ncbi:hypothetical protein [Lysobacter brunescens]|uniref:Sel1 repeat family protein n=1 Tax=Lysobacter brunescens TaxID=262323 RepID=A0ABW2Y9S3_9GAMM